MKLAWLVMFGATILAPRALAATLEDIIRDLDQQHAAAILAGDAAALDRLMTDEVTVNHPTNRIVN